jgi:hypothetical protein
MPVEPVEITPRQFESSIMRYVFNSKNNVPVTNVLMGMPGPRRKLDIARVNRTDEHMPPHYERLEYAKRLKMLSLNPCIYGNIYGVLANS